MNLPTQRLPHGMPIKIQGLMFKRDFFEKKIHGEALSLYEADQRKILMAISCPADDQLYPINTQSDYLE